MPTYVTSVANAAPKKTNVPRKYRDIAAAQPQKKEDKMKSLANNINMYATVRQVPFNDLRCDLDQIIHRLRMILKCRVFPNVEDGEIFDCECELQNNV